MIVQPGAITALLILAVAPLVTAWPPPPPPGPIGPAPWLEPEEPVQHANAGERRSIETAVPIGYAPDAGTPIRLAAPGRDRLSGSSASQPDCAGRL